MARIYAWDDEKISSSKRQKLGLGTFANKESLKKAGMQYDPDVKHWFTDAPDKLDKKSIEGMGIILDEGIALGDKSNATPGLAHLSNFQRRGSFIDSAKFRPIGKDHDGREIFEIDTTPVDEKPAPLIRSEGTIPVVSEKKVENPVKVISTPKKEGASGGSHKGQNAYWGAVQEHRDAGEDEETAQKHGAEDMKKKD